MNLSREQIEIINRCRKSVTFFLSNFGKIKHPSAGILPFKPFKYQKHALDCFRKYRLNIFRKCRQAGISKISGAFATWFALFHSHKTILIVSRVNEDAMGFLRENIVFLYEHLPDWMVQLWKPLKQNEHEIIFPNGSKIKSLTSHPDVLRSNASSLNIIDEAAFIQGMDVLWAGGWPCVRGDTLIQTSGGLQEIANLASGGNPWKDHSIEVATDIGYQISDKAYISGKTPTVKLTSYLGLEIEGTGHHRVRIIDESGDYVWQQLDTIKCGDLIAHMPGTFQGRRQLLDDGRELCEDFAEILGLYVGDGFVSSSPHRLKIVFDPQDVATRDYTVAKFNALKFDIQTAAYPETEYDTQNFRLNSKPFVEYMLRNGLKSKTRAQDAQIPAIILRSDRSVLCAFLRGLFDSDGWCYQSSTAMKLGFSTTSTKLAIQVQTALHALGILSRRIMVETDHTPDRNDLRYSDQPYWRVDVWDAKSKIRFRELIGFITKRKQACLDAFKQDASASEIQHSALVSEFASEVLRQMMSDDTFRNCTDNRKWNLYRIRRIGQIKFDTAKELIREFRLKSRLAQYITQGLHFDIIEHIENGETETFDLSVPANNTYLANGIVSHNTLQHGGNVIVISTCVVPTTYVFSRNGMAQIGDFDNGHSGFSAYDGPDILSQTGLSQPTKYYKRDAEATKKLITKMGYELESTHKHRLWICRDREPAGWAFADEVRPGDYVPIIRGRNVFGDDDLLGFVDGPDQRHPSSLKIDYIDEELAYMLGVILAEGYVADTYVTVTSGDSQIHDKFKNNALGLNWATEDRDTHIRCCSTRFVRFLKWFGFTKTTASYKVLPRRLWSCSRRIISAFLRGLYDGDGHSRTRDGEIGYTSTSRELIRQLRVMLCNYGIICREEYHRPYTKEFKLNGREYVSDCRESWQLIIRSGEADKFYEIIGFGLGRKNVNQEKTRTSREFVPNVRYWLGELRKVSDLSIGELTRRGVNAASLLFKTRKRDLTKRTVVEKLVEKLKDYQDYEPYKMLKSLIDPSIYWDIIKTVEDGWGETVDFSIPDDPTFWSNGLMSHNTNGVGNWYWSTCTDAESGLNGFNPVMVNWWDMDWAIEYQDPLSKMPKRIAPCDNIRKSVTADEVSKYGRYWSPWLEEQYRGLQEQGEGWKFKQEVLASFIGSGNTVLPEEVLSTMALTVEDPSHKVTGRQTYIHPVSGEAEELNFDFSDPEEGLWIWEQPVLATPDKKRGDVLIEKGAPAHSYVCGVDISTGKAKDFSAIQVFDVDTMEQVAEFMARVLPRDLVRYIDRIARWYNCATLVIERNNGGDIIVDELRYNMMYPKLWRKKDINDKPQPASAKSRRKGRPLKVSHYGFMTTQSSKASLNKYMLDYFREKDGYAIYSRRLLKQLNTYVRKRDRIGRDTNRTEAEDGAGNFDDLVMAAALALVALSDNLQVDATNLMPTGSNSSYKSQTGPMILTDAGMLEVQEDLSEKGGSQLLMPMSLSPDDVPELAAQRVIDAYTVQLGGIPMSGAKPVVVPNKFFYEKTDHA
jgi:intein/homing endonuclease